MSGTSIESSEKKEYMSGYITTETVISSEKVEDYLGADKSHYVDEEKSSINHNEDEEDSPIEEVRAVVSK